MRSAWPLAMLVIVAVGGAWLDGARSQAIVTVRQGDPLRSPRAARTVDVSADGATIVAAFDPQFPAQIENVSFGQPQATTTLVATDSAARVFVPPDDSLADTWTQPQFEDSSWAAATLGIGYEADTIVTTTDETILYGTSTGAVGSQAYGGALGHDFRVNAPVKVNKLGVFDSGANGLATAITAQVSNEARHPADSATGTATSGGTNVLTDSAVT